MTRESAVLRELEYCLSHFRFYVIPRNTRASSGDGWSIWNDIDPARYVGVVWRSNTGAMRNERKRLVRFGVPGLPDFEGWIFEPHRRLAVEAKSEQGTLTADQAAHLRLARKTGVYACVARSYSELQDYLISMGLTRKAT